MSKKNIILSIIGILSMVIMLWMYISSTVEIFQRYNASRHQLHTSYEKSIILHKKLIGINARYDSVINTYYKKMYNINKTNDSISKLLSTNIDSIESGVKRLEKLTKENNDGFDSIQKQIVRLKTFYSNKN